MAVKRIIVRSSQSTKWFRWWDTNKELREDSDGIIGKAEKLEDAVALAKVHTGGSNQRVEIKDA